MPLVTHIQSVGLTFSSLWLPQLQKAIVLWDFGAGLKQNANERKSQEKIAIEI